MARERAKRAHTQWVVTSQTETRLIRLGRMPALSHPRAVSPAAAPVAMFRQMSLPLEYLTPPALAITKSALFLFGGRRGDGGPISDLWRLDFSTGAWVRTVTEGPPPLATDGHALIALRGRLLLTGSRGPLPMPASAATTTAEAAGALVPPVLTAEAGEAELPSAELWSLDLNPDAAAPLRWSRLATPPALRRLEHCAASHEEASALLVHGGAGLAGLTDDLWQYDELAGHARRPDGAPAASAWSLLNGDYGDDAGGAGGLRPAARRRHSCAVLPRLRAVVVLGGSGAGDDALHDAWSFDLEGRVWSPLQRAGSGAPSVPWALPRAGHATGGLEPPIIGLADRAIRIGCEAWGGSLNETDSAPRRDALWQYSGRRRRWERLAPRGRPAGGANLAPPPCPRGLGFAHASASRTRAFLVGRLAGGAAPAVRAPRLSPGSATLPGTTPPARGGDVTLWEYAAGRDCPLGCEHGTCEPGSGACVCAEGWGGDDCSQALCGTPCGEHGTCDVLTRECICSLPWFGPGCAQRTCAADCVAPRGTCDANDGRCLCAAPWYGRACEFARCPPCAGPSARCDNATGACRCAPGYEGADCASLTPGRWHRDLQLPSAQRDEEAHPVGGYSPRGQAGPGLRYGASHGVCDGQPVLFSGVVPDGDGGGGDYGGDGGGGDGDGGWERRLPLMQKSSPSFARIGLPSSMQCGGSVLQRASRAASGRHALTWSAGS